MAAGGGERRGGAAREEGAEGVVFWRPPRPPRRALALVAAARVDSAGGKCPSVGPVPRLLPASAPRPPMSQPPWYRPLAAAR